MLYGGIRPVTISQVSHIQHLPGRIHCARRRKRLLLQGHIDPVCVIPGHIVDHAVPAVAVKVAGGDRGIPCAVVTVQVVHPTERIAGIAADAAGRLRARQFAAIRIRLQQKCIRGIVSRSSAEAIVHDIVVAPRTRGVERHTVGMHQVIGRVRVLRACRQRRTDLCKAAGAEQGIRVIN